MLSKVHLKTACNCERSFFSTTDLGRMPREVRVPIKGDGMVVDVRLFKFVRLDVRSKHRIELWYEEAVNG